MNSEQTSQRILVYVLLVYLLPVYLKGRIDGEPI